MVCKFVSSHVWTYCNIVGVCVPVCVSAPHRASMVLWAPPVCALIYIHLIIYWIYRHYILSGNAFKKIGWEYKYWQPGQDLNPCCVWEPGNTWRPLKRIRHRRKQRGPTKSVPLAHSELTIYQVITCLWLSRWRQRRGFDDLQGELRWLSCLSRNVSAAERKSPLLAWLHTVSLF